MQTTKKRASRLVSGLVAALMLATVFSMTAFAAGYEDLDAGTYSVNADLSCYVSAMGGVEFGRPMLTGSVVKVNEDGSAEITLSLAKSSVTIYGVTAATFIDPTPPKLVQFYDGTAWQNASYTQSADTAPDSDGTAIHYVDSITFTLPSVSNTYQLALYVNSNVMGVQFGGQGSNYNATLTVDWDSASAIYAADETSTQSSNVVYTVTGGYEVSIPSTIVVDSSTKIGTYTVLASDFVIADDAFVTVTAETTGFVASGTDRLAFSNVLESRNLTSTGEFLNGTVTITELPSRPGTYSGTLDFTISYFTGEND